MGFSKICVIGLGYIGLPTASSFAAHGLRVVGVDINQNIISVLQNGGLHIQEPGLDELVRKAFVSGNLSVQLEPEEADAFIIAVPTPFHDDKRADMRFVASAAESIVPVLRRGNLVILESTSPPQTTNDLLKPILERSGLRAGEDFSLAYSPERVLPGQILRELVYNARVIGGINPDSAEAGRELYSAFVKGDIILTDSTTAEMVKLMENTYRDINIAIANEFSRLADRFGVDVREAIQVANLHPRVKILNPGPGVGGHCISVDPWFLVEAAPDLARLIRAAREVNDGQPRFVVDSLKRAAGSLFQRRICVLGLTYKADVDDMRESPAVEIVKLLQSEGALVSAFEPYKTGVVEGVPLAGSLDEALQDAEVVLVLVGHAEFKRLSPDLIKQPGSVRLVFDTVNVLSEAWEQQDLRVYRLGNGKHWMLPGEEDSSHNPVDWLEKENQPVG